MIDLDRKLIIVGGKGGVGRSSSAAGLAVLLARPAKKVLVVDAVASGGFLQAFTGGTTSVTPGVITPVTAHGVEVSVLEVATESSLQEYVERFVPLPVGSSRLISLGPIASVFDYVSNAAPAVKEILTIGKIGHEVRNGGWDTVVVDGPATGHLIELLSAPDSLTELVNVGPLIEQTAWLGELLNDATETSVLLVTTPEELPVSELVELNDRITNETACHVAGIIVNRVPPVLSEAGFSEASTLAASDSSLAPAAQIVLHRSTTTAAQLKRIEGLDLPTIQVEETSNIVETYVQALSDSTSAKDQL